jgi:curved DNA-binding protein CbpA
MNNKNDMNYTNAFKILEIDLYDLDYTEINLNLLKKKYHKLALQNHPDKNGNTIESKEHFQKINEAYSYLKREIKFEEENLDDVDVNCKDEFMYINILYSFLKDNKYNDLICKLIKEIILNYKNISLQLFEKIDKETLLDIYIFLSKYKNILHFNQSIIDNIKEIINYKYKEIIIYNLNPNINDLLENNIYKLFIKESQQNNKKLYLVPLWHNELYFDNELIVLCEPELPENISIDENNNIYVTIEICIEKLKNLIFENKNYFFQLDKINKKVFEIQVDKLLFKKQQYYKIKKEGISKINENDIFDISEKADIIINIQLLKE